MFVMFQAKYFLGVLCNEQNREMRLKFRASHDDNEWNSHLESLLISPSRIIEISTEDLLFRTVIAPVFCSMIS